MKTVSSLALGHASDREYSSETSSFPCSAYVTLAVGNGGCCASTPKEVFFSPRCDLCAADSADCSVISRPREKFIMFAMHKTPAAHAGPRMKDRRDEFCPRGGVSERDMSDDALLSKRLGGRRLH